MAANEAFKYAILLPDGAADEPVAALGGRTPLEAAHKPHMDALARSGRLGRVVTVPAGLSPGSDVATLSLFGYDPRVHHPGRAALEAVARGLSISPDELIFRCNFVTLADGAMQDFTAGHITAPEAGRLIDDLNANLGEWGCRFFTGVSYRNLMTLSDARHIEVQCTPPHDFPGEPVARYLPSGRGADRVRVVMERARKLLAEHEINLVRADLGENPATDIWLWGQGRPRALPSFEERFGVRGACIAAVDLIRGIAQSVGMALIDVPGATGYLDTDYGAKGRAAVEALEQYDLVVVHVEAPDEAGHLGDVAAKVSAIEQVDSEIVGPLMDRLRRFGAWRMLIAPDHPTPVGTRVHSAAPPPFCLAGTRIPSVVPRPFGETTAGEADLFIEQGHELMEFFLRG